MIKRQFEVRKERLGSGSVVRDSGLRRRGRDRGARRRTGPAPAHGVMASPLPGPSGNVEYFAWLRRGEPLDPEQVADVVSVSRGKGPQ
jgi:23S rRNA (cytidine1920-2'-O)/16S rRNA (cytidine1409-2'-O)-methyltransferase